MADISTHCCVLLLVPASNPASRGCVWRSVSVLWKFTRLSKAAFPPAWKTPHICVPAWAWSFVRLSLVLSPWLRNSEKAGLVLVVLCHSGIPGLTLSGEIEAGSYIGWLLPQIFQHIHNKSSLEHIQSVLQLPVHLVGSWKHLIQAGRSPATSASNLGWGPTVWFAVGAGIAPSTRCIQVWNSLKSTAQVGLIKFPAEGV